MKGCDAMPDGLSIEQCDWLDRKGVVDVSKYVFVGQTDKNVYLKRRDIGLKISRKKDIVGWKF